MTDKIKLATDGEIAAIREVAEKFPKDYTSMLSLIARIEAQQAEIDELKSERNVDVVGERDQVAKLLAEAIKEIERLNDELQAQVESYRDRVSEIERLRGLCGEAAIEINAQEKRWTRYHAMREDSPVVVKMIGKLDRASKGETK